MPKTGTSSIQDSLCSNRFDPRFCYINLAGQSNGGEFMNFAFMDDPLEYWVYKKLGYSRKKVAWLKGRYQQKLRRKLRQIARAKQTAIISAEVCWRFKPSELEAIRDLMSQEGFNVQVIAYLRPIKSWLESNIQQNLKYGRDITTIAGIGDEQCMRYINYMQRLQLFEAIFGQGHLVVRPFTSKGLFAGCVVSDFCQSLGIRWLPEFTLRSNEGMSVDTVKMLYCFNQFIRTPSYPSLASNQLMLRHFHARKGEAFHLHSHFFRVIQGHIESQNHLILQRYDLDLRQDLASHDDGPCIRNLSDMMRFSPESLDWLSEVSQGATFGECEGVTTAQGVARQMCSLLRQPLLALWREEARVRLQHRVHVFLP
jgi:hypothetical protein